MISSFQTTVESATVTSAHVPSEVTLQQPRSSLTNSLTNDGGGQQTMVVDVNNPKSFQNATSGQGLNLRLQRLICLID